MTSKAGPNSCPSREFDWLRVYTAIKRRPAGQRTYAHKAALPVLELNASSLSAIL